MRKKRNKKYDLYILILVFILGVAGGVGLSYGAFSNKAAEKNAAVEATMAPQPEKKSPKELIREIESEATDSPEPKKSEDASRGTQKPEKSKADEVKKEPERTTKPESGNPSDTAKKSGGRTVVIDAGHQERGNNEKEPIGPGAAEKKPKVASGTTGVATKIPEYKVTLQVAKKLEGLLSDRGYNVIMVRNENNVNISNAERAEVANRANADAFVRIHCNGAESSSVTGALTMCQTQNNKYCGALHDKSRQLSKCVLNALCEKTGAKNRGVSETDSMSGINWCKVPVTIVEMGFMSNPDEDRKLCDDGYQDKLAAGIANGIDNYFNM